jgi:threonine/homoserine/homoserine lactone efflux protein
VVEVPTIVAIFLGLSVFLKNDMVLGAIGLLGGIILLYMGYDVFRTRKEVVASCSTKAQSPSGPRDHHRLQSGMAAVVGYGGGGAHTPPP